MAGPGDEIAAGAGGRGRLRASHADREQVIETLKAAFVQGRLTKEEFGARVGQVLASRTYAELAAVTADIPAGLVAAQPPRSQPAPPVVTDMKAAARMIATATAIPAALWAFVVFAPNGYVEDGGAALALVVLSSTFVWLICLLLVGANVLGARNRKRSGGQLPPTASSSGRSIRGTTRPPRGQRSPPRDTSCIRRSATLPA